MIIISLYFTIRLYADVQASSCLHKPKSHNNIITNTCQRKTWTVECRCVSQLRLSGATDLRTNLEVILLMIPVEVPLRCWARAPVSWDSVGEAGGPLYVALRRSRSWAPWKVLRLVVPRGKRFFSGVLMLCADGDVDGPRGEELREDKRVGNAHRWHRVPPAGAGSDCSPGFKLRVVINGRQCALWRVPRRGHGLGVTRSRRADCRRRGTTWHLG